MMPAISSTSHTIELIGSHIACHVESGTTVDVNSRRNRATTRDPIGPLCRRLLEMGHCPTDMIHIIRKALTGDHYIPAFKHNRSIKAWADTDYIESEARSVHLVKHRPFPDAVNSKNSRKETEITKGSSESVAA